MSGNLVESLIGALVLFVAASFLYFVDARTDASLSDSYALSGRFDNVTGIRVGSDVRLGGIKVGAVTGTKLDPETYQAIVTMSVNQEVQLPIDTAVAISAEGLLGGSFVSLLPGGEIDMLVDGDEFEETQDAVDLVGLISKFTAPEASSDKN